MFPCELTSHLSDVQRNVSRSLPETCLLFSMPNCDMKKEVEFEMWDRTIHQGNPGSRVFSPLNVEVGVIALTERTVGLSCSRTGIRSA